jgi:MFS transporter, MHS family, proline/betaine transporter
MRRRVILASILGNGLEWFDFVSYGYFASIIAKVFFPAESDLSLMLTYATFAVGFVVRPIGGIVLGAYADRYGRRRALSLLIVMMAFGTLTLGLTPAYASIGIAAPIIIVLGRVVQGISIGGEFGSATALLVEYAPPNRRMMFGSFQMSSQALGRVLATAIGLGVLLTFPPATVQEGAWRLSVPDRLADRAVRLLCALSPRRIAGISRVAGSHRGCGARAGARCCNGTGCR